MFEPVQQSQLIDEDGPQGEAPGVNQAARAFGLPVRLEDALEMFVEVLKGHRAQRVEDVPDLDAPVGMGVSAVVRRDQAGPACSHACRTLAGVRSAATGSHTLATTATLCSFQPYTQPCQPDFVQAASVSIEVWGTTPASRSFLCHTPPRAPNTVLSMATARPEVAHG